MIIFEALLSEIHWRELINLLVTRWRLAVCASVRRALGLLDGQNARIGGSVRRESRGSLPGFISIDTEHQSVRASLPSEVET